MTSTTKCEFCDKRGLPLLLVRDAIAPAGAGAPLAAQLPIALDPRAAHYTTRILRSGYVNIFDEARKRWEVYFVTQDGYYLRILQTSGVPSPVLQKPFNCPDVTHRALASCITVSDPANATTIWIAFSDTHWTDEVRRRHADIAYRKRHMREVDVKAILVGAIAKNIRPISQLTAVVAEYALDTSKGKSAFDWSESKFISRINQAQQFIAESEKLRPGKGAIVNIDDPAGIVKDLALLMKRNTELFINKNDVKRKLAASTAIRRIEQAVRDQAETDEIEAAEQLANQQIADNPLDYWLSASSRKKTEGLRHVSPEAAARSADRVWSKYRAKFDTVAHEAWEKKFNTSFKEYDVVFISPLAAAHSAWMKSGSASEHFQCNYDENDAVSGACYTKVVLDCIASTQDKKACGRLYDEWLNGDIEDKKNILLRAFIFNQEPVADAIKGATTVSISPKQLPWDNAFAIYTKSVERLSKNARDLAAAFVVEIAGPLARFFGRLFDGFTMARSALMALGLVAGHPVVVCEFFGTKKQFNEHIVKQLVRASGRHPHPIQMRRAIDAELKRLQMHGVPVDGDARSHWILFADREHISAMPSGLSRRQEAQWLRDSLRTVEQLDALNLEQWRTVINRDVRYGTVAGIMQAICLTKAIADQEKSLLNERFDASSRLFAGITAVAGTTSEVRGKAFTARASQGLRYGEGMIRSSGSVLAKFGARAGIAAGLLMVGLDVRKGLESQSENQNGLAWLYFGSAAVGLGLTVAIACAAAIPVIFVLVILLIGIGVIIEYVKDNPVQDWLERCPWGKMVSQRYPDFDTEQAELAQALK